MNEFAALNQTPLGDATALIEEQFPNEFAYAFFDDSSAMHVGFAGTAPAGAVALLKGTDLPYVVIESVGFNAAEYQQAATSVGEQTRKYVTSDRQVQISQDSSMAPGAIKVSFQSDDAQFRSDPGLRKSITVDTPFRIIFDFTNTSPISTLF
ncbi:hypothetical protein [Cryobacterium sp. TMT4-31]|uniref:hypothetical protein n=1 Tax=Cryobacterium sp. TMT4-31 TaxID=1259259 RepID=UPI00106C9E70|nr:hypothetical protein [Cryobacterium sp. TMT4-31]TFC87411.1 hypothetical protein E3T19_12290 [Cryobacterium sp. TMT4-31]